MSDRKEYNLRKNVNIRSNKNILNEKELLRKTGLLRNYNMSNRRNTTIEQDKVEEGFYDDFPAELIKRYKLKVSSKVRNEVYSNSNKKQKTEPEVKPELPEISPPESKTEADKQA